MYLLVDFPAQEEGADTMGIYVSWLDLDILLSMPSDESLLSKESSDLIRSYINTDRFSDYATHYDLQKQHVFINATPLIVNAGIAILPVVRDYIEPLSTESSSFSSLFAEILPATTKEHEVNCGPIAVIPVKPPRRQ